MKNINAHYFYLMREQIQSGSEAVPSKRSYTPEDVLQLLLRDRFCGYQSSQPTAFYEYYHPEFFLTKFRGSFLQGGLGSIRMAHRLNGGDMNPLNPFNELMPEVEALRKQVLEHYGKKNAANRDIARSLEDPMAREIRGAAFITGELIDRYDQLLDRAIQIQRSLITDQPYADRLIETAKTLHATIQELINDHLSEDSHDPIRTLGGRMQTDYSHWVNGSVSNALQELQGRRIQLETQEHDGAEPRIVSALITSFWRDAMESVNRKTD